MLSFSLACNGTFFDNCNDHTNLLEGSHFWKLFENLKYLISKPPQPNSLHCSRLKLAKETFPRTDY